jgi:hypothetical protein
MRYATSKTRSQRRLQPDRSSAIGIPAFSQPPKRHAVFLRSGNPLHLFYVVHKWQRSSSQSVPWYSSSARKPQRFVRPDASFRSRYNETPRLLVPRTMSTTIFPKALRVVTSSKGVIDVLFGNLPIHYSYEYQSKPAWRSGNASHLYPTSICEDQQVRSS